jgi:hypothetical protein
MKRDHSIPLGCSSITAGVDEQDQAPSGPRGGLGDRLARRRWPIIFSVVFFLTGVAFLLAWNPLVHHVSAWATGGDLWGIYRGAHYVGWGSVGDLYTNGTGIVAFPGMAVLLSPVALITWHLHMTESFGPYTLAHRRRCVG